MKRFFVYLLIIAAVLIAALPVVATPVAAPSTGDEVPNVGANTDNPSHPLGDEQAAQREVALSAKLNGKANGKTHQVAKGQYVELAREGEDKIWTILAEFGTQINPPTVARPARCATRSRSRTAPSTTRPSGRRTSARLTSRTCCSLSAGRGLDAQFLHRAVVQSLHRQR